MERMYLRELFTNSPESLISNAANARIARSYFESKDYESAISALRSTGKTSEGNNLEILKTSPEDVFGNLTKNDSRTRENLVLLGNAYLQKRENDKARTVFNKLVDELPNLAQPDDFALEGVRGLDKIDVGAENFGKLAPNLSDKESLKRGTIYQFNRDFENARLHYQALIAQFPKNPNVPMAMYQIGRSFVQERNFSKATDWFERIQVEFPESSISQDALNQSASAYARVNKSKEAVSRYEKFIEQYPDEANIERGYLNIVDIMRDKGEVGNALKWTAKTREDFRDKLPEAIAIFAQARIHISQKDWQKSLADLETLRFLGNLGGTSVSGGTSNDEITFLKGLILENLNRHEEAIDAYLSIPDGRKSYYGWRANERLQALLKDTKTGDIIRRKFFPLRIKTSRQITTQNAEEIKEAAQTAIRLTDVKQTKEQLLETIRKAYTFLPEYNKVSTFNLLEFGRKEILKGKRNSTENFHQTLADELLFLGLYDEGTPELETAWQENKDQKTRTEDEKYTLAVYYKRGDMANRAVAFIEPLWRQIPDDFQIELIPRGQIELLYPAPYQDSLLKFAAPRSVDPRFVLVDNASGIALSRRRKIYRGGSRFDAVYFFDLNTNRFRAWKNQLQTRRSLSSADRHRIRFAVFIESFSAISRPTASRRGKLQRRRRQYGALVCAFKFKRR